MGYQVALERGWQKLTDILAGADGLTVSFLSDTYIVDPSKKIMLSDSCNVPAKDHISIILLHYMATRANLKTLPAPTGEWIDFRELDGGEAYYSAFKKRTIDRVVKKYGSNPAAMKEIIRRLPGEVGDKGDVSIVIHPFKEVSVLITMSKADEEFPAEANILFDKNIRSIFCTEDIVVLTETLVHAL